MADLFPETINKGQHGTTWTVGNWQVRNFHGYMQSREDGQRNWRFYIHGFGDTDCSVAGLDENGQNISRRVPIDRANRITIMGRKYGRAHWDH